MKKHKELTQLSMLKEREAHLTRLNGMGKTSGYIDNKIATQIEKEAKEILAINELPITELGEVSKPHIRGLIKEGKGLAIDTLQTPSIVPEEASIRRTDLLLQDNLDITSMAIDAANSIEAENSLEKMLAHQMALTHELLMKTGNAAMYELERVKFKQKSRQQHQEDNVEYQRLIAGTVKLMSAFDKHMSTLHKIRTGGKQSMTVQHVHVNDGGQALIGDVNKGG